MDGRAEPMDVVVRVQRQSTDDVRATLVAVREVRGVATTFVVDVAARPEIALLTTELGAVYAATAPDDANGLALMAALVGTPQLALLDAGDIPTPEFVERLRAAFVDERVVIVQGAGSTRSPLNRALGRRGCAAWTGAGSAVRSRVLRWVEVGARPVAAAHAQVGRDLLASGRRVVTTGGPAVVALGGPRRRWELPVSLRAAVVVLMRAGYSSSAGQPSPA